MAAVYKSSNSVNRGNVSSIVCDKPADIADGDHLTFLISQDGAHTITDAGGLTLVNSQSGPGSDSTLHVLHIYVASAAGAPASWTVTSNSAGGGTIVGRVSATGVNATTQLDVAAVFGSVTSATPAAGPIVPVSNGCLIIGANSTDPTSGTYTGTVTAGFTERIEFGVSATSNLYVETLDQVTAASVTTGPTMSSSDDYATVVLALRPVGAGNIDITAVAAAATAAGVAPAVEVGVTGTVGAAVAAAPAPSTEVGITGVVGAATAVAPAPTITILVEISATAAAATATFLAPFIFVPTGRNAGGDPAGAGGARATPASAGAVTPLTPGTPGAGGTRNTPGTPGAGGGRG